MSVSFRLRKGETTAGGAVYPVSEHRYNWTAILYTPDSAATATADRRSGKFLCTVTSTRAARRAHPSLVGGRDSWHSLHRFPIMSELTCSPPGAEKGWRSVAFT